MKALKKFIKGILDTLNIQVTKNQKYDKQTTQIMQLVLNTHSNCIDVGCHKGEVLDIILSFSPNGKHFAFEPIPYMFKNLESKYSSKKNISLFDVALSDCNGKSTFNLVKDDPAYSGLKKRAYKTKNPEIEIIDVVLKPLDEVIPENQSIDLIKIDVEGAELGVIKGAKNLISTWKPTVIFEHGKGASEFYGTTPKMIYDELNSCGLQVNTLAGFLKNKRSLSVSEFNEQYQREVNYYFVAYPG